MSVRIHRNSCQISNICQKGFSRYNGSDSLILIKSNKSQLVLAGLQILEMCLLCTACYGVWSLSLCFSAWARLAGSVCLVTRAGQSSLCTTAGLHFLKFADQPRFANSRNELMRPRSP